MNDKHQRKRYRLLLCLALCGLAMGSSGTARGASVTTIDAPGAGTGIEQGTIGSSINDLGAITGNYADVSNVSHGFLRASDGTFTTFDAPGAVQVAARARGPAASIPQGQSREATSMRAM